MVGPSDIQHGSYLGLCTQLAWVNGGLFWGAVLKPTPLWP